MVIFLQTLVWLCQAMVVGAQFIRAACPTQGSPVLDCAQRGQINSKEAFLYVFIPNLNFHVVVFLNLSNNLTSCIQKQ